MERQQTEREQNREETHLFDPALRILGPFSWMDLLVEHCKTETVKGSVATSLLLNKSPQHAAQQCKSIASSQAISSAQPHPEGEARGLETGGGAQGSQPPPGVSAKLRCRTFPVMLNV